VVASLLLADGNIWGIVAGDERAAGIVSRLAEVMQFRSHDAPTYRLLVLMDGNSVYANTTHIDHRPQVPVPWTFLHPKEGNTFTLICSPALDYDMLANQLMQLSLVIARQAQNMGGILLHGALIERDGRGVILAGPGGVGKTTASRRLPLSWRSLSDDATLVVCDEKGAYWAHPWPTWSYFMSEGPGGTWDVNHAVPLQAIFFLQQAQQDRVEPVATGQAVCLLVELAEHTSWPMAHGEGKGATRTLRLERFENICTLVKDVSCYYLHLGLHGAFWQEIERVITEGSKDIL
jgi:SynChlorMet cassette protein ScmC